jgi:hypothetical protein
MKTKEVEVWLDSDEFHSGVNCFVRLVSDKPKWKNKFKAKLIIEIPEKKIEITESEFDEWYFNKVGHALSKMQEDKRELGF